MDTFFTFANLFGNTLSLSLIFAVTLSCLAGLRLEFGLERRARPVYILAADSSAPVRR